MRIITLLAAGALASCASAAAVPAPAPSPAADDDVVTLRAAGPSALAPLLARYDRMQDGPARERLALTIDAVAAQRYATVSRLYWYTDLDAAKTAARAAQKPILALRMLGRLDEDLSCANSRLFRTTLYANAAVSKFLRDNFILYWSSERPVPRVTIEFGDGRKLVRTTTGNSAHYVLDERGTVLDVLPGLYAPAPFQQELAKSVALARRVRGKSDAELLAEVVRFHQQASAEVDTAFAKIAGTQFIRGRTTIRGLTEVGNSAVARAQRATVSKAAIEVPDLEAIGIDAGTIARDDTDQWTAVGLVAFRNGATPALQQHASHANARPAASAPVLDAQSRTLIETVYTSGAAEASREMVPQMLLRLEQALIADTALNQFVLRQSARRLITSQRIVDFAALNDWIYANVFHTPKSDPWLGLLPRTDFTGLPGDGVVL